MLTMAWKFSLKGTTKNLKKKEKLIICIATHCAKCWSPFMFMIVPFWPEMMLVSEFSFENWIFILSPLYSCLTFGAYMLYRRSMMVWIFLLLVMRIEDTLSESSLWNSQLMDEKLSLEVVMILYMSMILKQISLPSKFQHTRYCYHLHKHLYYVFLDLICRLFVWLLCFYLSPLAWKYKDYASWLKTFLHLSISIL